MGHKDKLNDGGLIERSRSHVVRGNAYFNLNYQIKLLFITNFSYAFPRKAWERGKTFSAYLVEWSVIILMPKKNCIPGFFGIVYIGDHIKVLDIDHLFFF